MLTAVVIVVVVVVVTASCWSGLDGLGGSASGDRAVGTRAGVDGGVDVGVNKGVGALVAVGGGVAGKVVNIAYAVKSFGSILQRLWVGGHDLGRDDVGGEDKGWADDGGGNHVRRDTSVGVGGLGSDGLGGSAVGSAGGHGGHGHAAGAGRVVVGVILGVAGVGVLGQSWGGNGAEEEKALEHLHLEGDVVVVVV